MKVKVVDAFAIGIRNGVGIRAFTMVSPSVDIPCEGRLVNITHIFRLSRWNVIITDSKLNDDNTVAPMYVFQMEKVVASIEGDLVGIFFVVERQLTRTHRHGMFGEAVVGIHGEVQSDDAVAAVNGMVGM